MHNQPGAGYPLSHLNLLRCVDQSHSKQFCSPIISRPHHSTIHSTIQPIRSSIPPFHDQHAVYLLSWDECWAYLSAVIEGSKRLEERVLHCHIDHHHHCYFRLLQQEIFKSVIIRTFFGSREKVQSHNSSEPAAAPVQAQAPPPAPPLLLFW